MSDSYPYAPTVVGQVVCEQHRQAESMIFGDRIERFAESAHRDHAIVRGPSLTRQPDLCLLNFQPFPHSLTRPRMGGVGPDRFRLAEHVMDMTVENAAWSKRLDGIGAHPHGERPFYRRTMIEARQNYTFV